MGVIRRQHLQRYDQGSNALRDTFLVAGLRADGPNEQNESVNDHEEVKIIQACTKDQFSVMSSWPSVGQQHRVAVF